MQVMKVDIDTLKNVVPSITSAKNSLNSCKETITSINIPGDFSEGERIKATIEKISSIESMLNSSEQSINSTISKFQAVNQKNNSIIDDLFGKFGKMASVFVDSYNKEGSLINRFLRTGATKANGFISALKGVGEFVEGWLDQEVVYGDASNYLKIAGNILDLVTGKIGKNDSYYKMVRDVTMTHVATQYVTNAYSGFYQTEVGKIIDQAAYDLFKSTGAGTTFVSGASYEATIAVLSLLTESGAIGLATFATKAGMGKETQNYWANARDNAKGSEWLTNENYYKGQIYGAVSGLWEGVTHYLGAEMILSNLPEIGKPLLNSAARVLIDSGLNALDTPVRAAIDAVINNKAFMQAFEEQGGWMAVLTNAIVGGVGSTIGEIYGYTKDINTTNQPKKVEIEKTNPNNITKRFIDNIEDFSSKGITYEELLHDNGIDVVRLKDKYDAAITLGDGKLYLLECARRKLNGNLSSVDEMLDIMDICSDYEPVRVGNINSNKLMEDLKPYLTTEELKTATDLFQSGVADSHARNYTQEQLDAIFNYTACGGFEINAWLNDGLIGGTGGLKARTFYPGGISEIQDAISGKRLSSVDSNRVLDSSSTSILEELDSVISSTNYDNAIVTYRGTGHLYDKNVRIDPTQLEIGDSFHIDGYQSSSVIRDSAYDKDVVLEIIVPPNSGTAAYIENVTGVSNYGQMEMLIKRDADMTLVDDIRYETGYDVNGNERIITIVPVIVQ